METKSKKDNVLVYALVLVCVVLIGIIGYLITERSKKQVFVISDNGRFTAKPIGEDKQFVHDIKNHIKVFVNDFFEYDKYTFNEKIESGIGLVDESTGKMIYKSLKDAGIYEILKDKKVRTTVKIDTLLVDMAARPIKCKVLYRQYVYIGDVIKENPVGAIFNIVPFNRSEFNPFGQLIVNFKFISYEPSVPSTTSFFRTLGEVQQEIQALQQENQTNQQLPANEN